MLPFSNFHFVGLGGIGMSGLARLLRASGKIVTGSDREASPVTEKLLAEGVQIQIGENAQNVPASAECVVHTLAAKIDENLELSAARTRGLPLFTYPEALGAFTADYRTVAVAGAHGKSTTASLIIAGGLTAQIDLTCLVGTNLKELGGGNARLGASGGVAVIEACEYRRAFLNFTPEILVVTNIEAEHLDYYRDLADYQSAFAALAAKLPPHGVLIANSAEPNLAPAIAAAPHFLDAAAFTALAGELPLGIPGAHNRKNAALALAAAAHLGWDESGFEKGVTQFAGSWRRFELKGEFRGVPVIDDYAHHPTEIRATLAAARERYPAKRLVVVYQQHQLDRATRFRAELAESLAAADLVLMPNIYAVRDEAGKHTLTAADLIADIAARGTSAVHTHDFAQTVAYLRAHLTAHDVLLVAGAGDIFRVTEELLQ